MGLVVDRQTVFVSWLLHESEATMAYQGGTDAGENILDILQRCTGGDGDVTTLLSGLSGNPTAIRDDRNASLIAPPCGWRDVQHMRRFNTAGPVRADEHYCVPPLDRVSLAGVLDLICSKAYFALYAPRQTGKTSALLALRDLLNDGTAGAYRCAYINVESAQTAREDVGRAMGAIATEIAHEAQDTLNDPETAEAARGLDTTGRPDVALGTLLRLWTKASATPLVLLIDEIDALVGDSLVSVLRQLRAGYAHRPAASPAQRRAVRRSGRARLPDPLRLTGGK